MCCLAKDQAQRKPHIGEDAVIVCMPTRGQICYETHLALHMNMGDVKHTIAMLGRKPVVEARNTLARWALDLAKKNPFPFIPRQWFVLWADDDSWWQPGSVEETVRALNAFPQIDAIFGKFSGRIPYGHPFAYRNSYDGGSYPREGIDCAFGDLVPIARAGFHWVLMRLSLLERVGDNPFDIPEGSELPEDFAFCDRAIAAGATLTVGMGAPIFHVDPRDGTVYLPGMPAMIMKGNGVAPITYEHQSPDGTVKNLEQREYGKEIEPMMERMKRDAVAAAPMSAEIKQRRTIMNGPTRTPRKAKR